MAFLRLGRCCSRRQGGCLQHRTEAQRQPKGQDAGGTPALPGDAVPVVQWRVPGGRLLRMPTCTLWETPVCPRAGPRPPRRGGSFESETGFVSDKQSTRPTRRYGSYRAKQGCFRQDKWRVPGAGKRLMTSVHLLNDCPEINKMLNVSFKSLSTSHYSLST